MKRTLWHLFLALCSLVGCLVFLIVGFVFFSSYELQRLKQEEPAYTTPEEAFLARHSWGSTVEIEGSAEDIFGLWYVGGWVSNKDETTSQIRTRSVGSFFVSTDDGWVFVPENARTFLMGAGLRLKSFLGVTGRSDRSDRVRQGTRYRHVSLAYQNPDFMRFQGDWTSYPNPRDNPDIRRWIEDQFP